jgi:hypothetical protein
MARVSPTLEGFRAAFRRPSLTFAEIAWRWTVGAVGWGLSLFWLVEYLDTLLVTKGDAALLSTKQPFLVGRAIAHILRGSLNRAVLSALVVLIALALLWVVAASVGRVAAVRRLLDRFRNDGVRGASRNNAAEGSRPLGSVTLLNFLRAIATLAAVLALIGAAVLASFASPHDNPQPGLVFILFFPMAGLVCLAWSGLNWLLSLAAVFAIRDGLDALEGVSAAVAFFREHSSRVVAVSTWAGLAHLVAFSIASTAVSLPLAFIQLAPWRLVVAIIILVTLAYFAIVDWLYIVRLAGYVFIAEMPEALAEPAPLPLSAPPVSPPQTSPPQNSMDRDELILSDIPNLAVET